MNFKVNKNEKDELLVEINELDLKPLQDLLNTINTIEVIDEILIELYYIRDKEILKDKDEFWEDELLGDCFTIVGYDNGIVLFVNNKTIYIEDEFQFPNVPRVKYSIEDFIKILDKWKGVVKKNS